MIEGINKPKGEGSYFCEIQELPRGNHLLCLHLLEPATALCMFEVQYKETSCPGVARLHPQCLVAANKNFIDQIIMARHQNTQHKLIPHTIIN